MRKLNNKGFSTVELLVCFVLIVIITVSMYSTVSTYRNKQQIESYKEKIMTYTNLLTKEIQDDLIKRGLVSVSVSEAQDDYKHSESYAILMTFRDGSKKNLKIERILARDYDYDASLDGSWEDNNDYFMISYGNVGAETKYPIPNLGYGENDTKKRVYDLRIQNIEVSTKNNILTVNVDFYHVDLRTRYGIHLVCPINF